MSTPFTGRRAWTLVADVAGVAVALVVVVVCGLRALHAESSTVEVAIVVLTPWFLLPAVALASVMLLRRRWVLAVIGSVTAVCIAVWEVPVLWPFASAPAAQVAGRLRLFDANVSTDNPDLRGIAGEIAAAHPAVVALEELTPASASALAYTGVLAGYRWQLVRPRYGAGGMGVWADLPMTGLESWTSDGTQVEMEGWLHPPGVPAVRLDVVHVFAPVGRGQPARWRQQLAQVRAHLAAEPRPIVVAGDFNATSDVQAFRQILGLGLSDAAVLAGRGWEMTWPRNQAWVIPYLRIDHVLLSSGLTVLGYRLGVGEGSDHRPLIVDIGARPESGRSGGRPTTLVP